MRNAFRTNENDMLIGRHRRPIFAARTYAFYTWFSRNADQNRSRLAGSYAIAVKSRMTRCPGFDQGYRLPFQNRPFFKAQFNGCRRIATLHQKLCTAAVDDRWWDSLKRKKWSNYDESENSECSGCTCDPAAGSTKRRLCGGAWPRRLHLAWRRRRWRCRARDERRPVDGRRRPM